MMHPGTLALIVSIPLLLHGCGSSGGAQTSRTTTTTSTTLARTTTTTTTTTNSPPWGCKSSLVFDSSSFKAMSLKGMAMDDTTMSQCVEKIAGVWPHTKNEPVKYLRLFAAWKTPWGGEDKMKESFQKVVDFCHKRNVKVLLGVDSNQDTNENDKQFQWGISLMQMLGKDHIIGFSFGNEMLNKGLSGQWWSDFEKWVYTKVDYMDSKGFNNVPVTVVWSGAVFPVIWAKSNQFINNMYQKYGNRWTWSVNPYAIWDTSQYPTGPTDCHSKSIGAVSIDWMKATMTDFRKAVNAYTGKTDAKVWIGETGWASPCPNALQSQFPYCPEFCSDSTLKIYYQNLLEWDGSLNDGSLTPAEYIFYFTNRDAADGGDAQAFGLIKSCDVDQCKLQNTAEDEVVI